MASAFERFFKGNSNSDEVIKNEVEQIASGEKDKRVIGKINKLDSRGFGFIGSRDIPFTRIFFHWTALRQDTLNFTKLEKGMQVEFTPIETEGQGWRAIRIKIIE